MLKSSTKKVFSLALCGLMSLSVFGTTLAEAHAAPPAQHIQETHQPPRPQTERRTPPPPERKAWKTEQKSAHSQGEVNTAAIVGAVVGAVLAKNI